MKFVEGAEKCLRWVSVQVHSLNAAFLTTWAVLPEKFQSALPVTWVLAIAVTLIALGVFGSLVHQSSLDKPATPNNG